MAACAAERNGMQSNDKRPVPAFLSASTLSMKTFSRKTGSKKKHLLEEKQHALEGQHNSQTAPTKSLTSLFDILLPAATAAAAAAKTAQKKSLTSAEEKRHALN